MKIVRACDLKPGDRWLEHRDTVTLVSAEDARIASQIKLKVRTDDGRDLTLLMFRDSKRQIKAECHAK